MNLFKKKDSPPEVEITALSDDDLRVEFGEALSEYERGVNANWTLALADIDDATIVSSSREDLHMIYLETTKRNLNIDIERLKQLDEKWQKWILGRIPIDLAGRTPVYLPEDTPKEEWWSWIEILNELSVQQRSTL